jgi:hypothetical protein
MNNGRNAAVIERTGMSRPGWKGRPRSRRAPAQCAVKERRRGRRRRLVILVQICSRYKATSDKLTFHIEDVISVSDGSGALLYVGDGGLLVLKTATAIELLLSGWIGVDARREDGNVGDGSACVVLLRHGAGREAWEFQRIRQKHGLLLSDRQRKFLMEAGQDPMAG